MKSITHENRRRFTILTIVSVLVVAILTTTLVLLLKKDTTAPTNTIEVGKRIDTSLGGGRKLLNASVWDGSSRDTTWDGSGTEANPYIISSAAELYGLAYQVNNNTTSTYRYASKYFLQTVDIDLNGNNGSIWTPIGKNSNLNFSGIYNGNGKAIGNIIIDTASVNYGLFGFVQVPGQVNNLHVDYSINGNIPIRTTSTQFVGGICASTGTFNNCSVENFNVSSTYSSTTGTYSTMGGICGYSGYAYDCNTKNITFTAVHTNSYMGGIHGWTSGGWTERCIAKNIAIYGGSACGGISGTSSGNIIDSQVDNLIIESKLKGTKGGITGSAGSYCTGNIVKKGKITLLSGGTTDTTYTCIGGIVGAFKNISSSIYISGNTVEVDISINNNCSAGGLVGYASRPSGRSGMYVSDNYCKGTITSTCAATIGCLAGLADMDILRNMFIGEVNCYSDFNLINKSATISTSTNIQHNEVRIKNLSSVAPGYFYRLNYFYVYYNIFTIKTGSAEKYYLNTASTTTTESTLDNLQTRSTYSAWANFDTYWSIYENFNDGIPILTQFVKLAQVTGFDGSGTEVDPYQIKTTADLQGMQAYYNEYDMIDEYWWKLVNNINISTDANGLTLNWTPIGYEDGVASGFNGHFDGNGKTISGLTITEQYENVGLFGRLASNATITNLNVSGAISWDQGKYVGGVVGHMEDGATLTNCTFTGTINGYLNSGNYAIVGGLAGRYSTDAITGSANYETYVYGANSYTTFNRYTTTYNVY
ncbi:MAG: hypothetical protein J6C90_01405 [Clostridia bacterium]|nr:hypothetical protein [Clostridia bacterium]